MPQVDDVGRQDIRKWVKTGITLLTVSQLKGILEKHGERRTGKKADLVSRLRHLEEHFTSDKEYQLLYEQMISEGMSDSRVLCCPTYTQPPEPEPETFLNPPLYKPIRPLCESITLRHVPGDWCPDMLRNIMLYDEDLDKLDTGNFGVYIMGSRLSHSKSQAIKVVEFPKQVKVNVDGKDIQWSRLTKSHVYGTSPLDITSIIQYYIPERRHVHPFRIKADMAKEMHEFRITAYLVEIIPISIMVATVIREGPRISKQMEITRIKHTNEADDDIVATASKVPLRDPVSGNRIKIAARSLTCTHTECFDLEAFYLLQKQMSTWACPFCNKSIENKDIALDEYMQEIIDEAKDYDIDEVEIAPDGSWTLPNCDSSRKRSQETDDDEDLPPVKRQISTQPTETAEIIELESEDDEATEGDETMNSNEAANISGLQWSPSWEQSLLFGQEEGQSRVNEPINTGLQLPGGGILRPGLNIMNNERNVESRGDMGAAASRRGSAAVTSTGTNGSRSADGANGVRSSDGINGSVLSAGRIGGMPSTGNNESVLSVNRNGTAIESRNVQNANMNGSNNNETNDSRTSTPESAGLLTRDEAELLLQEAERTSTYESPTASMNEQAANGSHILTNGISTKNNLLDGYHLALNGSQRPTHDSQRPTNGHRSSINGLHTPVDQSRYVMNDSYNSTRNSASDPTSIVPTSLERSGLNRSDRTMHSLNSYHESQTLPPIRKIASENNSHGIVDPELERFSGTSSSQPPLNHWPLMSSNFRPREHTPSIGPPQLSPASSRDGSSLFKNQRRNEPEVIDLTFSDDDN